MTIDWNEAAVRLKRDVDEHGGFLTLQRDNATRAVRHRRPGGEDHARNWWTRCASTR